MEAAITASILLLGGFAMHREGVDMSPSLQALTPDEGHNDRN
jgi:hypothetical protein